MTNSDKINDIMERLHYICEELDNLCAQMSREEFVIERERADRLAHDLRGAAAIEHYNDYMRRYNMTHLIIEP